MALVDGEVGLPQFTPERFSDESLLELVSRDGPVERPPLAEVHLQLCVGVVGQADLRSLGEVPHRLSGGRGKGQALAVAAATIGHDHGDKLAVELEDGRLILHPRPKDWVSYTAGSLKGVYGETKEDIDAYLKEVRGSWGTYLDEEEEASESK
ncbi:MAG: hypothetical protein IIB21_07740 [Chloroflexi bacterium]|nr:hypothetical protein [Chloroflexota bacterium]